MPVVPAVALLAYACACLFLWVPDQWWPEWDSAIYILAGHSLAAGEGYTYLDRPFFLRPPGLSWMISRIQPDGVLDGLALNRLIMFFAAATVAAVHFALRAQYGRWLSLAVALLSGTSWLFASWFNRVESEFPFMALAFAGIGVFARTASPRARGWWAAPLAGALFAGAVYVRTVGAVLIPGALLLAFQPRNRALRWRMGIAALVAAALVAPWLYHAREAAAVAEVPAEQLLLHDYTTAVFRVDPGDPTSDRVALDAWVSRGARNGRALVRTLSELTFGVKSEWLGWPLTAVLVFGWVRVFRSRPSLLEWFAVAYTGVVLTYFVYNERLVLPIVPLAYLYLFVAVGALGEWIAKWRMLPRLREAVPGALAALLLLINWVAWPESRSPRTGLVDGAPVRGVWEIAYQVGEQIQRHTPPDAVFLADNAPVFSLLSNRRVYSFRHARSDDLVARYDPDYVLIDLAAPAARKFLENLREHPGRRWVLSKQLSRGQYGVYEAAEP